MVLGVAVLPLVVCGAQLTRNIHTTRNKKILVLLRRTPGDGADAYLGLLYPTEEYRVFGCALVVCVPVAAAAFVCVVRRVSLS